MAGFLFPSNLSTSPTPARSFLFGTSAASSTPASSSLFGTPAASSTPVSSSLFGTPAASSTPASSSLLGASSVFETNSGLGFPSNLFGSSISRASTTTTTTLYFSSAFFGSSSSNSATPSPAFASSPFGASYSSSASSTPSFSNLFGSSSSSTSSSSASPFSSTVSPFAVSPSPFSGSTSAFSTQWAPAFSFPSTAGSSADSTSPFSLSSVPAQSFSTTTSSSLFTASFPTGSSSISPSLFAASSSSASAAVGFSFPTGSSSTFASSSAPAFSFPTGSNPAFSAGVDAVAVMTVEKRDEEAVPKPIEVGLVTVTAGLETEAVVVDIAEATFPNPREDGKPDEDEVPKEKLLDEELDVAEGVGEEIATDAELPVPYDIENAGLEPLGNENPGIAELPVPFDSENDEELDVSEGVGDVSTPGASTVTSGIAFPSFGASSSSTTTTTATSTTATAASSAAPTVSFPSFGTRSTAAPPGTTGLSFSLSTKTPTTASASHPQSAAMFAGTTSSTSSAAQSTSALAVVSCSGTTSTFSAAVASAPKLPSEITGKTVEEPHAAVQTARIAASTTIAISQEMPHGSTSAFAPICTSLPAASTGPRLNPLITFKMAPSRSSFDLSGGLASWRGFQVSPFSRESLERLSTQFPHMLDRFQLRTSYFQTLVLNSLAGLGDEMHNMLVSEVQEADLDRLKCIIDDLSIVGIDVSFFRDRLDVVASARRAADLSSAIAIGRHEHAMYTGELSSVESEIKDLRIKLEKMESVAKDLRAILTENEKARDAAITDLEALYTSSAQLDPSLSLDQGLL